MAEPNRLGAPGEALARERVEALFAAVDELSSADLAMMTVPAIDEDERQALLEDLEATADRHGRGALLDEARSSLRDALVARSTGTWAINAIGLQPPSAGRAEDLAGVVAALDDAVSVAVAEDLIDPDAADRLSERGRLLLGLAPRVASDVTAPRDEPPWAPTDEEWAAADAGSGTGPGATPGPRLGRTLVLATLAALGLSLLLVLVSLNDPAYQVIAIVVILLFGVPIVLSARRRD